MTATFRSLVDPNVFYTDIETLPEVTNFTNSTEPTMEQISRAYMLRDCVMNPDQTVGEFRARMVSEYINYAKTFQISGWRTDFWDVMQKNPSMSIEEATLMAQEKAKIRNQYMVTKCMNYVDRIGKLPMNCTPYDVYMCFDLNELIVMGW